MCSLYSGLQIGGRYTNVFFEVIGFRDDCEQTHKYIGRGKFRQKHNYNLAKMMLL